MRYFFILGNHPKLSQAEIMRVLNINHSQFEFEDNILLVDVDDLDAQVYINRLGGTIKTGQVYDQVNQNDDLNAKIIKMIKSTSQTDRKIFFGLSAYNQKIDNKRVALSVKKNLKNLNVSSRWVQSRDQQLSSVVVKTNKLLSERGVEIVLMKIKDKLYLGKTLAVQAFDDFSKRDYGRPAVDSKSGMLPPKVARMMINLADVDQDRTILDPFCGSGTILQEALVLGYQNIIGSDISKKAVEDTKKNLEWLIEQRSESGSPRMKISYQTSRLVQVDVRELSKEIKSSSINVIITEPYLGPPLRGGEQSSKIKAVIRELEQLYLDAFKEFKKVLKSNGRIVIIFPVINNQYLQILDQIKQLGFEPDQKYHDLYDNQVRQSFLYSREGQRVKREILVLNFKSKILNNK